MVRKDNLDDYELFYVEIPQTDLEDTQITEIGDEPNEATGLSADQVSEIAKDSAEDIGTPEIRSDNDDPDQPLFNN